MPRATVTIVDRFMIHAEASQVQMGEAIAALTRIGVTGLGFEIITDVRTFKKNKAEKPPKKAKARKPNFKANGGPTGKEMIIAFLKKHKNVTVPQLTKLFRDAGRNHTSVSPILIQLKRDKVVSNPELGHYRYIAPKKKAVKKAVKKEVASES